MSSDLSRLIFNRNKHYSAVRMQQGRVLLDSDWNEQHDLNQYRLHTQTMDVIGKCGVPQGTEGFKIVRDLGKALKIKAGRIYMGGLLCELNEDFKIKRNLSEPHLITGDVYSPPHASIYSKLKEGTHIIYIESWQREINYLQDDGIHEEALGGPDTTARLQTVWRVDSLPVEPGIRCANDSEIWRDFISPMTGKLEAKTKEADPNTNPCHLPESGGYQRLENQLYRIEIQRGGDLANATFKWSRDNASVEVKIESFNEKENKIKVESLGKDDVLGFEVGNWVEIIDHRSELSRTSNGLLKIADIDPDSLEITVDSPIGFNKVEEGMKLRRWDQKSSSPKSGISLENNFLPIEEGIQVKFSKGTYRTGDYWLIPARTISHSIEWPKGISRLPPSIKNVFCKLAIVQITKGVIESVIDCRPTFPPLTEISGGCCTVHVGENKKYKDIQSAVDSLEGGPGTVCVHPGFYFIDSPISIIKGNNIIVKGCEGKAIILNANAKRKTSVFYIQNSIAVTIQDFWCVSANTDNSVLVSNTIGFKILNCMIVAIGIGDSLGAAIAFHGFTMNTLVSGNTLFGRYGIRYVDNIEQLINFHIKTTIERNKIFSLISCITQSGKFGIMEVKILENRMTGFGLDLLSKSYIPQSIFDQARSAKLYEEKEMAKAQIARKKGFTFEAIFTRDVQPLRKLEGIFQRTDNQGIEFDYSSLKKKVHNQVRTFDAVIKFSTGIREFVISNNKLFGSIGMEMRKVKLGIIEDNEVVVWESGITLLEGADTIKLSNNYIIANSVNGLLIETNATNISIENNRIFGLLNGILFTQDDSYKSLSITDLQILNNTIISTKSGIRIGEKSHDLQNIPILLLKKFKAVNNTIRTCVENGIFLNALSYFQTGQAKYDFNDGEILLKCNNIHISGTAIYSNLPGSKIVENDIEILPMIGHDKVNTRGIVVDTYSSEIIWNKIKGDIDSSGTMNTYGGIYLDSKLKYESISPGESIIIRNNKILRGIKNGIEIATGLNGLVIEDNHIIGMGLNGIAVQDIDSRNSDIIIKGNIIRDCHLSIGKDNGWWVYAGIVLSSIRKAQIEGNVICENGRRLAENQVEISGFYAKQIVETNISSNQFINNGVEEYEHDQAVIHIASGIYGNNADIQISNNLISGSRSPSLILGQQNFIWLFSIKSNIIGTSNNKAIITNNHFKSLREYTTVQLQINRTIFSNNYVACFKPESSVNFGIGTHVMAVGNVVSAPIKVNIDLKQFSEHTLEF